LAFERGAERPVCRQTLLFPKSQVPLGCGRERVQANIFETGDFTSAAAGVWKQVWLGLAKARVLTSAGAGGEQINLRTKLGHRAQNLLHVNRTPFPAKDRHAWVSGDVSDAHQEQVNELNGAGHRVGFDRWLKFTRLATYFEQQVSEPGEVSVEVETLFNDFARQRGQPAAQVRIGQQ